MYWMKVSCVCVSGNCTGCEFQTVGPNTAKVHLSSEQKATLRSQVMNANILSQILPITKSAFPFALSPGVPQTYHW